MPSACWHRHPSIPIAVQTRGTLANECRDPHYTHRSRARQLSRPCTQSARVTKEIIPGRTRLPQRCLALLEVLLDWRHWSVDLVVILHHEIDIGREFHGLRLFQAQRRRYNRRAVGSVHPTRRAGIHPVGQWARVPRQSSAGLDRRGRCQDSLHRAR